MTTEEATLEVNVEEIVKELQTPKYLLKLGVPVTHRWKDKQGNKQSRTYPIGTELGVIFPFIIRHHNQKWADCITPDGVMLTIGHNKKHQLIEIGENDPSAVDFMKTGIGKVEFDGEDINSAKSFEEVLDKPVE